MNTSWGVGLPLVIKTGPRFCDTGISASVPVGIFQSTGQLSCIYPFRFNLYGLYTKCLDIPTEIVAETGIEIEGKYALYI